MLELKDWAELGSDALGAIGGLLVIVPVLTITHGQHDLYKQIAALKANNSLDGTTKKHLIATAQASIARLSEFKPVDRFFMLAGGISLILAFVLRCIYQWMDKSP